MRKLLIASLLLAVGFIFGGCDSSTNNIIAKCAQCKETLTLNFKGEKMYMEGDSTYFKTEKTLSEMQEIINCMDVSDGTLQTELYENCILIKIDTPQIPHTTHYYMVLRSKEEYYNFLSPNAYMREWDGKTRVLFPYHLLQEENGQYLTKSAVTFLNGKCYLLNGTVEELVDFYYRSGVYEVTQEENLIRFNLKASVSVDGGYANSSFQIQVEAKEDVILCYYKN